MRYTEEQKAALPKIYEKIKDARVAMLTTVDHTYGTLHSRPMAAQSTEPNGTLWFFTYANSEKAFELTHDAKVNLSYSDPGKDIYVSVSGEAEIVEDKEKMAELWSPMYKAFFPDGLKTPNIALLKVKIVEAEYWDASTNKMVKLLRMAKAIVTGEVAHPGDHDKIDLRKQ